MRINEHMKNNQILVPVVVAVIIAGIGGFLAGKHVSANLVPATGQNHFGQTGMFTGGMRRGGAAGLVTGSILSMDDKSITVQDRNGGSKIVFFSDSTQVMKSVDGTRTDLMTGKNVVVTGTTNQDGSVTAQSIQIRTMPPIQPTGNTIPTNQ